MKVNRLIIVFLVIAGMGSSSAQDSKGTGPKEKSIKTELSIRKQQRQEARERRKKEKAERKAIKKHHKRIQTKKVQKRMKESRNTAVRNNEHKREPFFKRWFRKKHRAKSTKQKANDQ